MKKENLEAGKEAIELLDALKSIADRKLNALPESIEQWVIHAKKTADAAIANWNQAKQATPESDLLETVKVALTYRDFGVLNEWLSNNGHNKIITPTSQILGEWQLCPKCNGSGQVYSYSTTNIYNQCDVCGGAKVLARPQATPVKRDEQEMKRLFAEHLGEKELNTTDAYAIEWVVKELK